MKIQNIDDFKESQKEKNVKTQEKEKTQEKDTGINSREKSKKRLNLIIIGLALVFVVLVFLFFRSYQKLSDESENITKISLENGIVGNSDKLATKKEVENAREAKTIKKEIKAKVLKNNSKSVSQKIIQDDGFSVGVNWNKLHRANSDFSFWLYIPSTGINYPVMQEPHVGRTKYLFRNFYGRRNESGSCMIPPTINNVKDFRTLVLAHKMVYYHGRADYMFSNLPRYYSYRSNAKNYEYVYTYHKDKTIKWKLWASCDLYANDYVYNTPFLEDTPEYSNLINHVSSVSRYQMDKKPDVHTPMLMLSTCHKLKYERNYGRFVAVFTYDSEVDNEGVYHNLDDFKNRNKKTGKFDEKQEPAKINLE